MTTNSKNALLLWNQLSLIRELTIMHTHIALYINHIIFTSNLKQLQWFLVHLALTIVHSAQNPKQKAFSHLQKSLQQIEWHQWYEQDSLLHNG